MSQEGMSILLRNRTLTDEVWLRLIGSHVRVIKPNLDYMTLVQLGDWKFLHGARDPGTGQYEHTLEEDHVKLDPNWRTTQGLFDFPYLSGKHEFGTPEERFIWGLQRNGQFMYGRLTCVNLNVGSEDEPKCWKQCLNIELQQAVPEAIHIRTGTSYYTIFDHLYLNVKRWEQDRREAHGRALQLLGGIEEDYNLLRTCMELPQNRAQE